MEPISISRDPLGLYPMYYAILDGEFVYSPDLSVILTHPNFKPIIDDSSLNELFSMGPAHSMGKTPFANVYEVKPGHTITYDNTGLHDRRNHRFEIKEHEDSYEDTLLKVKELLANALHRCRIKCSGLKVASLLSGGLDSSYVTASIQDLSKETYSLEFKDSQKFFTNNSFQPSLDAPYVDLMVDKLSCNHHVITCTNEDLVKELYPSLEAHGLPSMADIDASLLFFLKKLPRDCDIVFTGECSDELFAGYPWYHWSTLDSTVDFPWARDYNARLALLRDDVIRKLSPRDYCRAEYERACADVDIPAWNTPKELEHRKIMYLTMKYFMTTLIDRTNCCAKAAGVMAMVPFADSALAEYLFNVPYEMKAKEARVKNLLVECAKGILPEEIRLRKKSPFPKTYDPGYERLLVLRFEEMMEDKDNPILAYIDIPKVEAFLKQPKNLGAPWYGQLMCGPQLLAYYLQINEWMKLYM